MIELRQRMIDRYGEAYGRVVFVAECQRKGVNPVNGERLKGGMSNE